MKNDIAIGLETIVCRNDRKFTANKLGDEMVMMNMENGDFISMNKVGADIWTLSRHPLAVSELIHQLLALYNIPEDQCRNETLRFIQSGMEQKMFLCPGSNV